ncbi:MAG: undecaprenyldiphospho-muramoylpentapeptide beta-N-acetylglucosaminyltransferase [Bacilli bacterium]
MKVVITAGGTGGHIYPALAVYDKIMSDKNNDVLYIGTTDRMESEIVPDKGIKYLGIDIAGLSKNIFKNIKNIKNIIKSYNICKNKLKEYKPDIVIGFGGYVTLPVLYAAKKLHIKTAIHEQNIIPGKTNKYLSKFCNIVFVSFEESIKYFNNKNVVVTGNPCEERALLIKKQDKKILGFDPSKKLIIIVMGSLGSTSVNEKLCDFLRTYNNSNVEVLFITGKKTYTDLSNNLIVPNNIKIVPFINDLPGIMKSSDAIISRAGASTIAEILAVKLPSILVPSPYVSNNHQYFNALDMQNKKISILLEEKDINKEELNKKIDEILTNKTIKDNLDKITTKKSSSIIYD